MIKNTITVLAVILVCLNVCFAEDGADNSGIVLEDQYSNPYSNVRYVIETDGGEVEGFTDKKGFIPLYPYAGQNIPVRVYLDEDNPDHYERMIVDVGGLADIETTVGLQQRLNNLGYFAGTATGEMNENTINALKKLQHEQGLEVTGAYTKQTLEWMRANDSRKADQ